MKLFLAALTIWSLPFFGLSCGSANLQSPAGNSTSETITLTNQNPSGSFALQANVIKNLPAANAVPPSFTGIQIPVTKVVNPNARAVNIFVYLSRAGEKPDSPGEKIELGSFSLYPADHPGKFSLNPTAALRKAFEASNDANINNWRLLFELEQKPEQASSPLEITIATPQWIVTKG